MNTDYPIEKLAQNIIGIHGKDGESWIENLPSIVKALQSYWSLTQIQAVNNMSYNYVAKAIANNNQAVVLKICYDEKSIFDEKIALEYFNGDGSIRLIDYNSKHHALLLQQAVPGLSLKQFYPEKINFVMDCYVNTMQHLHDKSLPKSDHFPHISDWLVAIDNITSDQISEKLLNKALSLKKSLLASSKQQILLHGDLHHDNILLDNDKWLAIDPKGILGESEFEIAAFDFIHPTEFQNNNIKKLFEERTQLIAERSNLSVQRIREWIFVRLILSAAWSIEDNGDPNTSIYLAEKIL